MIFTPNQADTLSTLLATTPYQGLSFAALLEALNAPQLASNPEPQRSVFVNDPIDESDLFDLLTDPTNDSGQKVVNYPNLAAIVADIAANNHQAVAAWAPRLAVAGIITATEAQAIVAYCTSTQPDPTYQPQIAVGPSPFSALFPGITFIHADGCETTGHITGDMLMEVTGQS